MGAYTRAQHLMILLRSHLKFTNLQNGFTKKQSFVYVKGKGEVRIQVFWVHG